MITQCQMHPSALMEWTGSTPICSVCTAEAYGTKRPVDGRKEDHDKLDWTLLPWSELEPVVRVFAFGAIKYARDNYLHVEDGRRRYLAAALRHLLAVLSGRTTDIETGEAHEAHAVASILMATAIHRRGRESP